jgi:hypothetical protein
MLEFEVSGQQYRARKLTAFQQFHVSRKVAPILPTLVPVFVRLKQSENLMDDLATTAAALQPFADGLAAMKDEDGEFVISTCLSVVQRETQGNWAAVWSVQSKVCMFDDIDLGIMIPLILKVIQDSLGPFISGLLTSQTGSPAQA